MARDHDSSTTPDVSPSGGARRPAYLYRVYDADGLIYIGSTVNLRRRLTQHRSTAWWAPTVVKVRAELRPDLAAARRDETRAILAEKPRHNLQERSRRLHSLPKDEFHEYVYAFVRNISWSHQAPFGTYAGGQDTLGRIFLAYRERFGEELDLAAFLPEPPPLR